MGVDLQSIVDGLARRVHSSVAIDDLSHRLLVYSSNADYVDELRVKAIMARRSPERAYTHAMQHGLGSTDGPIRIPANHEFGMEARVCAPVFLMGRVFGYLWLIDTRASLTHSDLKLVEAAAAAVGEVLQHDRLSGGPERGRERELFRDLLADNPGIREHAAGDLVESGLLAPITNLAVVVAMPVSRDDRCMSDTVRLSFQTGLESMRLEASPRRSLFLARLDHVVALTSTDDPLIGPSGLAAFASRLHQVMSEELRGTEGWDFVVGVGDLKSRLSEAAESYGEAHWAARVGIIDPAHAPVARWKDLGVYRTLRHLSGDQITQSVIPGELVGLINAHETRPLVKTLECYLDHAGDAKITCSQLSIHRATLYYRLRRIEALTGFDLRQGSDRLTIHLSLKVARVAGMIRN